MYKYFINKIFCFLSSIFYKFRIYAYIIIFNNSFDFIKFNLKLITKIIILELLLLNLSINLSCKTKINQNQDISFMLSSNSI